MVKRFYSKFPFVGEIRWKKVLYIINRRESFTKSCLWRWNKSLEILHWLYTARYTGSYFSIFFQTWKQEKKKNFVSHFSSFVIGLTSKESFWLYITQILPSSVSAYYFVLDTRWCGKAIAVLVKCKVRSLLSCSFLSKAAHIFTLNLRCSDSDICNTTVHSGVRVRKHSDG